MDVHDINSLVYCVRVVNKSHHRYAFLAVYRASEPNLRVHKGAFLLRVCM
jgi:hypothetical protein